MEIQIEKAVLHVLDKNSSMPIFSEELLDLTDDAIYNFISMNLKKMCDDNSTKNGKLSETNELFESIEQIDTKFVEISREIADKLYKIMIQQDSIPSADLLVTISTIDGKKMLGIVKLNYKEGFTHFVDYNNSSTSNRIIKHRVIFSTEGQKTDEGVMIDLVSHKLMITEKEYLIDGDKINYFSEIFLKCKPEISKNEAVKIVNKVAKEINKKYFDSDFTKDVVVKEAIHDEIQETSKINICTLAQKAFKDNKEIQEEYIEEVKKAGVKEEITFVGEEPEKKFSKHKIKTENGIELSVPTDIYKDKNAIEFINNPDGTISILITNVKIKK